MMNFIPCLVGKAANLPFFTQKQVFFITLAPDRDALRKAVNVLNAWIIPSFGVVRSGDGYIDPCSNLGSLASRVLEVSPAGYFRWRCSEKKLKLILSRLRQQHILEESMPACIKPPRLSLYELRARFSSCLVTGDREGAEEIVELLDLHNLETALNTGFMRIRMWHNFGEYDRIRNYTQLHLLLAQPLPARVRTWVDDACGEEVTDVSVSSPEVVLDGDKPSDFSNEDAVDIPVNSTEVDSDNSKPSVDTDEQTVPSIQFTWLGWFEHVKKGNKSAAETFLQERADKETPEVSSQFIGSLVDELTELYIDDVLRSRERNLIQQGLGELLADYIREPEFPRATLGSFYLAFLQLWGVLHAGNTMGQEHSNVLLELANAVLRMANEKGNREEVCRVLEHWWEVKRSPSQIPYALDVIELLQSELPDAESIANLWIDAADVIKRASNSITPSERKLWRCAGERLGIDDATILEYLPIEVHEDKVDLLAAADLNHVAIVCMREEQAKQAVEVISDRCGEKTKLTVVTSKVAGADTTTACNADVVIYVWMASTHAVFRAFDGFDRERFCYVQGTGASSIVRTLERWIIRNK